MKHQAGRKRLTISGGYNALVLRKRNRAYLQKRKPQRNRPIFREPDVLAEEIVARPQSPSNNSAKSSHRGAVQLNPGTCFGAPPHVLYFVIRKVFFMAQTTVAFVFRNLLTI